jgi:hypothetical protein
MLKKSKFLSVAAAAAGVSMSASVFGVTTAEAASCSEGTQYYEVNTASSITCHSGNLNESSPTLVYNLMTFTRGIDDGGDSESGSPLSWGTGGDPMDNQGGSGLKSWSISLAADWVGSVLMELKQSNTYALADVTNSCDFGANLCSGTWSAFTSNSGEGSENTLSHTRAYYKDGVSVVPLPAAGWMLIAGLGAMGAMRRRKKS